MSHLMLSRHGIWCFRVDNLNPNQTLKTESSWRFVPIHSQLLALGLLDFINDRKGHLFSVCTWAAMVTISVVGLHGSGVSMVCLSIIHCATTPPQHLSNMASQSSSPPRYSGNQTLQLLITDTGKALMFRGWLNWWRLYRTKNYVSAKRRLNFLRSGSILRFWESLICLATAKR